ncbi:ABC transporter ATP-binding protein [Halorubrum vacuolatum]|uniref:ABC-2 type transport system ATP-binding protein n=1 Tax=Halorubrum vacuolatum TaxID=63740 RepID=A0A238XJA2_HALVU|nr:ABC transporter ATP-binding protein [Halorubrum vacuolatum]SNR58563.1 ABC-2 type transport system ATP-binding protein [Halorubrum vacuolatum]
MAPIEVTELTKEYGDVRANDAVTFSVKPGEVFGFLGPNGAGKSTTIRMLLGLLTPTAGTATVLGADIHDESALIDAKRRIGYLPAHLGFPPTATGEAVLEYHASMKGDERLDELLDIFTPPIERPIREYSTGNKRMLGLIQAFMHDPDLVIMDEPTSGLDPLKQEEFNGFIRAERDRGMTVFLSSHVLSEVRRVCDRVGIIRGGELVELEDIETLLRQGGKRVRVTTTDDTGALLSTLDGVVDVQPFPDGVQFIYTGEYNALLRTLARHDVREIDIGEPPLEDVFIHYYGQEDTSSESGTGSDA